MFQQFLEERMPVYFRLLSAVAFLLIAIAYRAEAQAPRERDFAFE
jgi:hypothetical protein